ncbi:MAG: endonuclease III [Haloplanus sp.]
MSRIESETRAEAVVDALGLLYHGELDADDFMLFPESDDGTYAIRTRAESIAFWEEYGGRDAFPCLVRTILSQNTSDVASQPAFDALLERYGDDGLAATLAEADRDELADAIRSAGLYNQKSRVIVAAAREVIAAFGGDDAFDAFVREGDPETVRDRLLEFDGVGPKTADCVLLFSGGRDGVFPVDTHVHRIARRMGLAPPDADHEAVRERLETDVSGEKCGFGHTATIQFGRDYCKARKPACLDGLDACPLADLCDRVGVSPETGEVRDPAEVDAD